MASCKDCIFYRESLEEFLQGHQDSTPEGEKPKEHFCQIYMGGIADEIWNGKKACEHRYEKD
jgi:hypothetical protein